MLPLADAAFELLTRRWEDRTKRGDPWVFPARSSKAKLGHYLDSKAILAGIRQTARLDILRTHDLRRTFGELAEQIASYRVTKSLLNHQTYSDPTERYTGKDWVRLKEAMQRIENAMLSTSPTTMNAIIGHRSTPETAAA